MRHKNYQVPPSSGGQAALRNCPEEKTNLIGLSSHPKNKPLYLITSTSSNIIKVPELNPVLNRLCEVSKT